MSRWDKAAVYQIYPKSFCDTNGDGVGDINGIISKLEYIQKLGIDMIWLSPVYLSPGMDNGYDVSDYDAIDPLFGSEQDFDTLVAEAHKRNLGIMMDLVLNHTSNEHTWFLDARSDRNSKKRDYYIWRDPKPGGGLPNNWNNLFGTGPAWTLDNGTGQYYLHLFSEYQPDLNWENTLVRQELYAMIRRWIQRGVDGFRLDVISCISKPHGLPDAVGGNTMAAAVNGPRVHEFLREMRREAFGAADLMTVGETAGVDIQSAMRYASLDRAELDMVFQFEVNDLDGGESGKWNERRINPADHFNVLSKWQTALQGKAGNSLYLSNHDQPRAVSRYGNEGLMRERSAKMLAVFAYFMSGVPFIYQGEELGMTNTQFSDISQLRDIEGIDAYNRLGADERALGIVNRKGRDAARTPMHWSRGLNAGFSNSTPWIGMNPNYTEINAEDQENDENSILNFYRNLLAIRKRYADVVSGDYTPLQAGKEPNLFAYKRESQDGGSSIFVICNYSESDAELGIDIGWHDIVLSNTEREKLCKGDRLMPYEAVVMVIRK